MDKTQGRIKHLDVVRGWCMLCLIAGHFGVEMISRAVFTFHVPAFFVISGYFFNYNNIRIKKKAIKLLKPYIFTSFIMMTMDVVKELIKQLMGGVDLNIEHFFHIAKKWTIAALFGSGSRTDCFHYHLPTIGAIWFLLALIWAELFALVLFRSIKNKKIANSPINFYYNAFVILGSSILWIIGYYSAFFTWLPFSIQAGLCGVIFLVGGNLLRIVIPNIVLDSKVAFAFCTFVWAVALVHSITIGNMSLVKCAFPNPFLNIIGAFCAFLLISTTALRIQDNMIGQFLQFYGKNSIIVLSFHIIELNLIPWSKGIIFVFNAIGFNYSNILVMVLVFILKILWSIAGIMIVHKANFLKNVYSIQ